MGVADYAFYHLAGRPFLAGAVSVKPWVGVVWIELGGSANPAILFMPVVLRWNDALVPVTNWTGLLRRPQLDVTISKLKPPVGRGGFEMSVSISVSQTQRRLPLCPKF
jgi:hypothetical protein